MFHTALSRAAKEAYEAMPTLSILIANVENENLVRIRTTQIAKKLNVALATVERHMKKLKELKIIEPDSAEGDKKRGVFNWRICPFLGWYGDTKKIDSYLSKLPSGHPWLKYNTQEPCEDELNIPNEVTL
jgi:hypothetical protein